MGSTVSVNDPVPATEFVAGDLDGARDFEDSLCCRDEFMTQSMFVLPTSQLMAEQSLPRHSRSRAGSISNLTASVSIGRPTRQTLRRTIRRVKPVRVMAIEQELRRADERERLFAAAARGDTETVSELLSEGVDVNSCDANHLTALHYAAMHARPSMVELLLDHGANPNAYDTKGGFTPLHWAVINSHSYTADSDKVDKTILALARGGCEVNRGDFNQATPLHFAARTDNRIIVETLMGLGADPNIKDIQGCSAAKVARSRETTILIIKLADKRARAVYHVLHIPEISVY